MRFLWLGVKILSALTDVGVGQFTTTMAQPCIKKPERKNLEVEQACRPASGPCKPVSWVFNDGEQMKNRGTKCTFILVVVRPTVAQSSFHTEFLSSIRFSPLQLLRRRKRTGNFRAFLSGHEEELKLSLSTTKIAIKTTGSRTVRMHVSFVKVAENSFQYFSRLKVWWVIITTLYLLTPTSWY